MSGVSFPSGEWVGFYTYSNRSRKFLMDLILEFKSGKISGEGMDDIGPFIISGRYQTETLECFISKSYVGKHSVEYTGFREGKGIWGTWVIAELKGGFHIWPLSGGDSFIEEEEKEADKAPFSPRKEIKALPGRSVGP